MENYELQGQLEFYDNINRAEKVEQEEDIVKVFAGIYKDKGVDNSEAEFMILYGNTLCLIYDGMSDIFGDCEVGGLHLVELVQGYSLAVLQLEKKWQIRDSGRKHTPDYIIAEGSYTGAFPESLDKFKKALT